MHKGFYFFNNFGKNVPPAVQSLQGARYASGVCNLAQLETP